MICNKKTIQLLSLVLTLFLLTACGSKKQVARTADIPMTDATTGMVSLARIVEAVNALRTQEQFATAKVSVSLRTGDRSIALSGNLRMKRDDVIQLQLYALGIMEVGRLEVTPDYFLVIDKMGRQYMKASFADVPFLRTAGVDFQTLQALFWDELFVATAGDRTPTDQRFLKTQEGSQAKLVNKESRYAVLTFLVDAITALNRQTLVSPHAAADKPYLRWEYSEFGQLGDKKFPTRHQLTIANGAKPINVGISLSSLKNEQGWSTRTDVSRQGYTEVSVEKVIQRLMTLTL